MPFEINQTPHKSEQPKPAPEHLKKGMLEAGSVFFEDIKEAKAAAEKKELKHQEESTVPRMLDQEMIDRFFPSMDKHDLRISERGAFSSLVNGSGISWEELADRNIAREEEERIKKITQKYIHVYLSAHPDLDKMKQCYKELRELVQGQSDPAKLDQAA
jgi:hypothetical protein